jgi:carbamoyl-phosphate synthase large subunit
LKSIRVLVTGAGSGVAQGIIKSLRISNLPVHLIVSDIAPLNSALFRGHEATLMPKVESEGSLDLIIDKIARANIDVILIGSEFDLNFYAAYKEVIESKTKALVAVSPLETVRLAEDKWLTVEFLKKNKLPYPRSHIPVGLEDAVSLAETWGYPVLLKTRIGTSNRHVHVLEGEQELVYFYGRVPKPMLQQVIRKPSNNLDYEYTCSVFKCADGRIIGPFTARRTLRGGSSWVVEIDRFEELHPLLLSIGTLLPVMGSLNIQLMMGVEGPVPFEFNARFSGTTAVRAHFGFNEPEMTLRHYFLQEELPPPKLRRGLAFRYLEEVFVENAAAEQAEQYFTKGVVRGWF